MIKKHPVWEQVADYGLILLGNFLYALSVTLFIRPLSIPLGGVGGIALLVNDFTGFPMGLMIILANIPLFLLALRSLGRTFLIKTCVATLFSSLLLDLLAGVFPVITEDPLLSSLYGGVLMGVGLGMVFSRGATSGGSDILSKLIQVKHEQLSLGRLNMLINALVIAIATLAYRQPEAALYALVVQYVSSTVIDTYLAGFDNASAALIITDKTDEISSVILKEMHRGVTGLTGAGMYTNTQRTTLLCAARAHEITLLKKIIAQSDPNAFVILLNAREVLGRGFKSYGT